MAVTSSRRAYPTYVIAHTQCPRRYWQRVLTSSHFSCVSLHIGVPFPSSTLLDRIASSVLLDWIVREYLPNQEQILIRRCVHLNSLKDLLHPLSSRWKEKYILQWVPPPPPSSHPHHRRHRRPRGRLAGKFSRKSEVRFVATRISSDSWSWRPRH